MLFGIVSRKQELKKSVHVLFFRNLSHFFFALFGIALKVISGLGFSSFTQKILDTICGQTSYSVNYLCLFAVGCVILLFGSAVLEYFSWTKFRETALNQYRMYIYQNVLGKRVDAFSKENTATYVSILSNDLNDIQYGYIESLPFFVEMVLSFVGTLVFMLFYNVQLSMVAIAVSAIPVVVSSFQLSSVAKAEEKLSWENSRFLKVFSEVLQGFKTIKNCKAEEYIKKRLSLANNALGKAYADREHKEISVAYIASIAGHVSQIVFFFFGMFIAGKTAAISVGMIVAFVQLMANFSRVAISMPELIADVKAAENLMIKNEGLISKSMSLGKHCRLTCQQGIDMEGISLCYNGNMVIDDLSLKIQKGQCIAIVGESGSGKSTLLNIISGINKEYTGKVCFDGVDSFDIDSDDISELVGVIFQESFIFDASIKDNITLFEHNEQGLTQHIINAAGLSSLIDEKGVDYICGEQGNLLSGGERQRISIARSLALGSEVLLFDEVTSSLDEMTGRQIMRTILSLDGKTRVVVTHDIFPDLMGEFDDVYMLVDGKLQKRSNFMNMLEGE